MKVIVDPNNLKKGMYVSELDRPWLDTPFLFQGFRITNHQEVEQIKDLCDFVFVDTEKSTITVSDLSDGMAPPKAKTKSTDTSRFIRTPLPYSESFEGEFHRAVKIHEEVSASVSSVFSDLRAGRSLDVEEAKETVKLIVDSILRHPDALVLLASLGSEDSDLVAHAVTVCTLSISFGRYLGFDQTELMELGMGALLHDIGETKLPTDLLSNAQEVNAEQRELLEGHTTMGVMMMQNLEGIPENVIAIARDHHERANGSGYPRKLLGAEISVHTQIVAIVDTYDSVTGGMHGKAKIGADEALKCIYSWREELFDPLLVEKFIQCIGIYPLGSLVELRSKQIGIVVSTQPEMRLFPKVMLIMDSNRNPVEPPRMLNLALFQEKLDNSEFEIKRLVNGDDYGIDVRRYILRELPLI